jgi:SAM-dependent MidA family methyltransferase
MVEVCLAGQALAGLIGGRIARHGGVALIVDYGGWRSRGDTLQAVRRHARADPLEAPGEADLTAHVDFEALARAASAAGAAVAGPVPQGVLLERLGIGLRARALAARLAGPALEAHLAAHRRLTHPEEMGSLFRAIALHAPGTPPPPGFDGEAP